MKIVKKLERRLFKHGESCVIYEYPTNDRTIDGCIAKISGRYPEKGGAVNKISKELAYVINGAGTVTIENKTTDIGEGDMVLIQPNEKFYWEGEMELFIPCTPAWNPEQYEIIV